MTSDGVVTVNKNDPVSTPFPIEGHHLNHPPLTHHQTAQFIGPFSFLGMDQYHSSLDDPMSANTAHLHIPLLSGTSTTTAAPDKDSSLQDIRRDNTALSYQPRSRHFVVIEISHGENFSQLVRLFCVQILSYPTPTPTLQFFSLQANVNDTIFKPQNSFD